MTPDRLSGPARALLVTIALLCVRCGSFETPHAPTAPALEPDAPGTDAALLYEEVEVEIVPSTAGIYTHRFDGDIYVMPAWTRMVYARFLVRGADGGVTFGWDVCEGLLPPGISLDPRTGEVTGVATKSGDWGSTICATAHDVVDGKLYVAKPYDLSIRVAPACESDADCVVEGFGDYTDFQCTGEFFKGTTAGACTVPIKPESCPTASERVQVWVHQAGILPAGKSLSFTALVEKHEACLVNRFSMDAGGDRGYCLSVRADRPQSALSDGEGSPGPQFLDISYRLPHNYPAPIRAGERYRFLYMGSNVFQDDHIGDGTLVVFEEAADTDGGGAEAVGDEPTTAVRSGDLVLLAHTGRLLPTDLLTRCAVHGACPRLAESHPMPTRCVAVSQSSCGARTPLMLLARKTDGSLAHLETGQKPIRIDRAAASDQPARSYALHLGLSDTFVGDEALACADGEDDYRLSYFVLPSDACLLARVETNGPALEAPAQLMAERSDAFAPDGQSVEFAWDVELEPTANALFRGLVDGIDFGALSFSHVAYVPGYYALRQLVEDDRGTEACDRDDGAIFSVVPPSRAYVELSRETKADLELRLAPVAVPWTALTGQVDDPRVANPANVFPDWGVDWIAASDTDVVPPFYQARAADLVDGAGVQSFDPGDDLGGRYRIGILYRGNEKVRRSVVTDDEDVAVTARVRVLLDQDLRSEVALEADLSPCWFWEVGVLDLDAEPPTLSVSPHEPAWVCGRTDPLDGAFQHEAQDVPEAGTDVEPLPANDTGAARYRL